MRWWIYRGSKPYPHGIFRPGVDDTALDNIPLTAFRDLDASALVHWSAVGEDYPVVTRRGTLTHHVRRLALHDVRMQNKPEVRDLFNKNS